MTSTFQMVRELGWSYLEKLAQQQVLQIQSATDTPKKIVLGERPVMADGNESNVLLLKEEGKPIEVVYAAEGTPSIVQPSAVFTRAPHPNAARLFQNYLFSVEGQELFVSLGGLEASRPLMPPVEVSKERELHSRNGATLPCCSFRSVFRRQVSQRTTGMPTRMKKNSVITDSVKPS